MKIDYSQIQTAEQKAEEFANHRLDIARSECGQRIAAQISEIGQINLAADLALGLLSDADVSAYRTWRVWVSAMRNAWRPLAESVGDIQADENWPAVPPDVVMLATRS